MKTQLNFKQIGKTAGVLLAGLLLGWLMFGGSSADQPTNMDQHVRETHTDEEGNIVYTCSMHPQIRESEPGNCPICGMELIPVGSSESAAGNDPYTMTMSPVAMKLAEVATATVRRTPVTTAIRMPGKVVVDERRISTITALFPGRIEELYVDFTGQFVEKGQKLASIYSPALITAQKELLEAQQYKEANPALYQAARRKLELWHLSEAQINDIESTGTVKTALNITAPVDGYVLQRSVSRKEYVQEGTVMYKLADLSELWVHFEAYESDLTGVDAGSTVEFTTATYPGRTLEARISYIDPVVDPAMRTVSLRAEVENESGLLKPNMLAEGVVHTILYQGKPKLQVPRSAVLWTGTRSLVYVRKPGDTPAFEAREVVLGNRAGDSYVVLEGLQTGEEVVVQGNFMIDSAAQLAGKVSMMNHDPGTRQSPGMPGMPGMDMGGGIKNSGSKTKMEQTSQKIFPETENSEVDKAQVPDAFKEQLDKLVEAYLVVKDALTKDNLPAASSGVNDLDEALSDIDMNLIEDDEQMQAWMTRLDALKKHIGAVEQAEDLAGFRRQFALLSEALAETLTTFGVERPLYVQFCPMARAGEGAYWVSAQEEIVNPYLGQTMPNCGETKKEMNPNR